MSEMLRFPEVQARVGLSRTTIWRKVRARKFPPPIALGENSVGWPADEIENWLASQPRRNYGGGGDPARAA